MFSENSFHIGKFVGVPHVPFGHDKRFLSAEDAEHIALTFLGFLGRNPEHLGRFLAETGLGPESLRAIAGEPGFLVGLLDFLLSDETLLLAFTEAERIRPTMIAVARHKLEGGAAND